MVSAGLLAMPVVAQNTGVLPDQKQKVSYSMGVNIGTAWKRQDVEVDLDTVVRGIKDAMGGNKTLLTEEEMRTVMTAFQTELRTKQQEKRTQLAEKNKAEGEVFLAANKTKPGVITLPSGLQYKILKEGTGPKPGTNDEVTVNYRGMLIGGTEFDSSEKAGKPATFRVTGVIKGWTEAVQLMNAGSKWQLFIPSELAYAQFGRGLQIGPNAALIFDIELLSFKSRPPPAAAAQPGLPATSPNGPPTPVVSSDIIKVPSAEEFKKGAKIEVIKAEDLEKLSKPAEKK
ncbi:MAG: peptidylprolyl isomerase [Verrucomicrobia bacterium]|nr:MAG: peptidylprolyl isomerase [Verrucomicrobiota bacterium]